MTTRRHTVRHRLRQADRAHRIFFIRNHELIHGQEFPQHAPLLMGMHQLLVRRLEVRLLEDLRHIGTEGIQEPRKRLVVL